MRRHLLESTRDTRVVPAPVLVEVEWPETCRLGPQSFESVLSAIEDGESVARDLAAGECPDALGEDKRLLARTRAIARDGVVATRIHRAITRIGIGNGFQAVFVRLVPGRT